MVSQFPPAGKSKTTIIEKIKAPGAVQEVVTSRPALAFSPVSLKRYENAVIKKVSEQVFQTFRTPHTNMKRPITERWEFQPKNEIVFLRGKAVAQKRQNCPNCR